MKWFSTKGRASRAEYFWLTVLSILGLTTIIIIAAIIIIAERFWGQRDTKNEISQIINGLILFSTVIIYFITEICLTVRRLHDLERSGTHYFLFLLCGKVHILLHPMEQYSRSRLSLKNCVIRPKG